jgi:hypothetical protein
MATEDTETQAPPVGEEIHLPEPSILPLILAAAIAVALVGITTTWLFTIAGGIVAIVCIWRWIGETRRDVSRLPVQHRE